MKQIGFSVSDMIYRAAFVLRRWLRTRRVLTSWIMVVIALWSLWFMTRVSEMKVGKLETIPFMKRPVIEVVENQTKMTTKPIVASVDKSIAPSWDIVSGLKVPFVDSIMSTPPVHAATTRKAGAPPEQPVTHVGHELYGSRFALSDLQKIYLVPPATSTSLETSLTVSQSLQQLDARDQRFRQIHAMVRPLTLQQRKRILVTGGAGFVGSHLVDRLMLMGHHVIVMDNFFTGRRENIEHWLLHPHFTLLEHDITDFERILQVDQIYHLACPASPPHYQYDEMKTIDTSVLGTRNMLKLAQTVKARLLFTSTSEVYGDPKESPQSETYWGHVNPIGIRACYDEGKRIGETMCYAFEKQYNVQVRVARIFNTFGPRMHEKDGRVVSNFIIQALRQEPLTVYGTGQQTRSFQYVHDLVDGLIVLMERNYTQPVNIGNPEEFQINEFAEFIRRQVYEKVVADRAKSATASDKAAPVMATVTHLPATQDDPQQRLPDIRRAAQVLEWKPQFSVHQGIAETIAYFQGVIDKLS